MIIIALFSYNIISINSTSNNFENSVGNDMQRAIDSGNFSQIEEARENMNNFIKDDPSGLITTNQIKYSLYILGTIYSIIIFILCFRLKTGTLEKLTILIGGIMTYGIAAILIYFFDIRKKFILSE